MVGKRVVGKRGTSQFYHHHYDYADDDDDDDNEYDYDYDYDEDDDNYNDANFLLSVKWHLCGTNSPTFYLKGGQLNRFGGKC